MSTASSSAPPNQMPRPRLVVLDPVGLPSGREQVTRRPAWRIRTSDGATLWAFVERREGRLVVTGYPVHQVDVLRSAPKPVGNAVVGASFGALIGAALGGPAGAWVGGAIGAVLLAGAKGNAGT